MERKNDIEFSMIYQNVSRVGIELRKLGIN